MIYGNRGTETLRAAVTRASHPERVTCPASRDHTVRHRWRTIHGIRTGALYAWCYECRREIPEGMTPPVTINDAERARGPFMGGWKYVPVTDDSRRRNAEIRLLWGKSRMPLRQLAERYGLTVQRISQILKGRNR